MHMKKLCLLFCFSLFALITFAQDGDNPQTKKGSLIGFSINLTDFTQPLAIKNSFKSQNANGGFSIMYWKGLIDYIDLSIRYNGIFTLHKSIRIHYQWICK